MRSSRPPRTLSSSLRSLALLLGVVGLTGPAQAEEYVVDRIAAVVNDEVIALSEIYDLGSQAIDEACPSGAAPACRTRMEREVVDALVRRALIRQELAELGYDVTAADVDNAIDQVVRENDFPDREALRTYIERGGAAWDAYRDNLKDQLRAVRFQEIFLRSRVTVSEDELRDRYQRRIRDLEAPEVVELTAFGYKLPDPLSPEDRIRFVSEFRAVLQSARDGARTFESLVDEYDTARLSPVFAGRTFERSDLADALSTAAFDTEVGAIAEPVVFRGVLYGLRIDARREGELDVPAFEAIRDDLAQAVLQEKYVDAEERWYQTARRKAAIRIHLEDPDAPDEPAVDDTDED